MLVIEENRVREILTPALCLDTMRQALRDLEEGKCDMPSRLICRMPNTAAFGFMPAYVGDCFGAKVIAAYAPNMGTEYPSHIGYVMLFESEHCTVQGLIEAGSITEIRTGCVSAVATDLLAKQDAPHLCLIGCGAQARSHLLAISLVRKIEKVTVYDLSVQAAEAFKAWAEETCHVSVQVCDSPRAAAKDADIICTLTPSKEAYLTLDMVKPGAHVNAVGTFSPVTREAASDLVAAARLYADQVDACRRESGEYLIPLKEGLCREDHIVGSVGELLLGKCEGRRNDTDITLFDALGLAVEDIAAARQVYLEAAKSCT
ncbi:MAG: ornithine cyclodeaminase family protein [Clostridia bacterium]|nr:ornithine cyclodeaminase family protein [Clostridia bacterium]